MDDYIFDRVTRREYNQVVGSAFRLAALAEGRKSLDACSASDVADLVGYRSMVQRTLGLFEAYSAVVGESGVHKAIQIDHELLKMYDDLLSLQIGCGPEPLAVTSSNNSLTESSAVVAAILVVSAIKQNRLSVSDTRDFDWATFRDWLNKLEESGVVNNKRLDSVSTDYQLSVNSECDYTLPYKEFSAEGSVSGAMYLLTRLVIHNLRNVDDDDPFYARDASMTFLKYLKLTDQAEKAQTLIQQWWIACGFQTVQKSQKSLNIFSKFLHLTVDRMASSIFNGPYECILLLLALHAGYTESPKKDVGRMKTFLKYLELAPLVVPLSTCVGTPITADMLAGTGWISLLAYCGYCSLTLEEEEKILRKSFSKISNCMEMSNLWEFDNNDKRFGLLGLGTSDFSDGLVEYFSGCVSGIHCEDKSTTLEIAPPNYQSQCEETLALMHIYQGNVARSIGSINRMALGNKKLCAICFDSFFVPFLERVGSMAVGLVPWEPIDPSLWRCVESLLEVINGTTLMATTLSGSEQFRFLETAKFVLVARLAVETETVCGELFDGMFERGLLGPNEGSGTVMPKQLEKMNNYLARVCLASERGSLLGKIAAKQLGVSPRVCAAVVDALLASCYDSDVDEFADEISNEDFFNIILPHVWNRIAICIQSFAEDSSQLHGLMYSLMDRGELAEWLAREMKNSTEKNSIREWLLAENGPREILQSCTRLLLHPKMVGRAEGAKFLRLVDTLLHALDNV